MNANISSSLDEHIVDEIKKQVKEKHDEYNKTNDIIGSQIFNILDLNSRILFYPLGSDEVWGFFEKIKGESFVCINTSLPYDKQIFAAAHELYHLWYDSDKDLMLSNNLEETGSDTINIVELKANRFAAEFLVSESLLMQEVRRYSIAEGKIYEKDILKMADLFSIPYKTMVRRFFEVGIINEAEFKEFITISATNIEMWRVRLGFTLPARAQSIKLDNLVDKSLELHGKRLITLEKLEYLLGFAKLSPAELGISSPNGYITPTDEELLSVITEE